MASRWYPTRSQLGDPAAMERAMRQVLDRHYELQDRFDAMQQRAAQQSAAKATATGFPPGSGPADSVLLGIPVAPVDTQTLADGTKLTWVKAQGVLKFM